MGGGGARASIIPVLRGQRQDAEFYVVWGIGFMQISGRHRVTLG